MYRLITLLLVERKSSYIRDIKNWRFFFMFSFVMTRGVFLYVEFVFNTLSDCKFLMIFFLFTLEVDIGAAHKYEHEFGKL